MNPFINDELINIIYLIVNYYNNEFIRNLWFIYIDYYNINNNVYILPITLLIILSILSILSILIYILFTILYNYVIIYQYFQTLLRRARYYLF